ncbi:MAG: YceI family protein [Actinomycetes bacterium]
MSQTQSVVLGRVVDGVQLPTPGTYTLDPTHTRVGFVARHLMVTKVRGRFADIAGSITVAEDPQASTAEATLTTASVDTGTPDRDTHLKSEDFFDVEKHPQITFRNARVLSQRGVEFKVAGDLTVKDVTREVTLDVEVDGVAKDPWGGTRLAVTASTELDREDWGLTWNVALETGGVLVSKKVKLEIEAQAVLQQA